MNIANVEVTGSTIDSVFNGAQAGVVENVTVTVVDNLFKTPDNGQPDYNLYYEDEQGRSIRANAYWEEDPNASDDQKSKLEAQLASLWSFNIPNVTPPDNATVKEILERICSTGKKRVIMTYGTTSKPSAYLNSSKYKFMESMLIEPSKLIVSPAALLVKPPKPNTNKAPAGVKVEEPLF